MSAFAAPGFAHGASSELRQSAAVSDWRTRPISWWRFVMRCSTRFSAAVFIVGRGGKLLFANAAAEALLARGTCPSFEGGSLGEAIDCATTVLPETA